MELHLYTPICLHGMHKDNITFNFIFSHVSELFISLFKEYQNLQIYDNAKFRKLIRSTIGVHKFSKRLGITSKF